MVEKCREDPFLCSRNSTDLYDSDRKIGVGSYGSVMRGRNKATGVLRAIKIVLKVKIRNPARTEWEINLMRDIDHPYIIKLFDLLEDQANIYLVLELCAGRELFNVIASKKRLTEGEVRGIFAQILRAVNYLHGREICHGDLKPENLLFAEEDTITSLKLIDCAVSKPLSKCQDCMTRSGSVYFLSPEVLAGSYGLQSDMWSAWAIFYALVSSSSPLYSKSETVVLPKIRRGLYNFKGQKWTEVFPQIKVLIEHLWSGSQKAESQLNRLYIIPGSFPHTRMTRLSTSTLSRSCSSRKRDDCRKESTVDCVAVQRRLCDCGELFDFMVARIIFTQSLHAINYLHSHEICHHDLKPENLFFAETNVMTSLKLIDFGLSKLMHYHNKHMTTRVGTPYYTSPDVLSGNYGLQCDMWGVGILLYLLICGYPPFNGNSDYEVLAKIRTGVYDYGPEWENISPQGKDRVDHLLVLRPEDQLTAEEALNHPWIVPNSGENSPLKIKFWSLFQFKQARKLHKSVLLLIAPQCNEQEIASLKGKFENLDTNGDGILTFQELQRGLSSLSYSELRDIWENVDMDKSDIIDYTELLTATMHRSSYLHEKLWAAFLIFYKDWSGKISAAEVREVLGKGRRLAIVDPAFWDSLIQEADRNGDREIDFIDMMSEKKMQASYWVPQVQLQVNRPMDTLVSVME